VKNAIRALLDQQGLGMRPEKRAWSDRAVGELGDMARDLADVGPAELWRGQLKVRCAHLEQLGVLIEEVTAKLDAIAAEDDRVGLLRSIPGVGPCGWPGSSSRRSMTPGGSRPASRSAPTPG
jgi:transposase